MTKLTRQKHICNSCITTYTIICYYLLLLLRKAVLVANEAVDVQVKVDETKYVVTSDKQDAGQSHNIRLGAHFSGKFHVWEWHEQVQEWVQSVMYFRFLFKSLQIEQPNNNFECFM